MLLYCFNTYLLLHIVFLHEKYTLVISTFTYRAYFWFLRFSECLCATTVFIVIAVILSLVFVRGTYIYHVYIILTSIFLLIIFYHLILVHIFTPLSILSYYALHHVLSILMTHTSTQISRRQ